MEDQLLLFCLSMENEGSKASVIARWTDSEWNELIRQSARHGLSAYLHHRLKALNLTGSIPPPTERRLREITLQNASQNIRMYHELGKALKTLRDDGIPVILLKGAYMAEAVYGSIALRRMGDVDILVKKEDLHKTVKHLFQMGFRVMNEELTGYMERIKETRYHILPELKHFFDLVHPDWTVKLDVHVSLTLEDSSFAVDTDGLWERAVRSDAGGVEALVLSPVDSLLYQCIHASFHHHFMFGLRPLCDIAETIRRFQAELNWDNLRLRSRGWKADKCAWITLRFAREILGTAVPDDVLTALKPKEVDSNMVAWARAQIFKSQSEARSLPDDLIKLWKSSRLRDKAAAVRKAIFPSRQVMAVMYPASPASLRIYLYYPVRLKDLFVRWGRTGLRLLFRDKKALAVIEGENKEVALRQWLTETDQS
jgi:hypothetical protein